MTTIQCESRPPPARSGDALDRAADAMVRRHAADVDLLVAAVEWAEPHPAPVGGSYAGWGEADLYGEGVIPLAGDGAPLVAEFAPVELAAVLHWSTDAARELMGDGLELTHRLPRLYAHVLAGRVPVHQATYVARHTRDLSPVAAATPTDWCRPTRGGSGESAPSGWSTRRGCTTTPTGRSTTSSRPLAERKVELLPGATPLTTDVHLRLDTHDAEAFDAAVTRGAEALAQLGDHDPSTYAVPAPSACSPTRSAPSTSSRARPRVVRRRPRRLCSTSTPASSTAWPPRPPW